MLDREPITVFGDGEQTRSNTYIDDAVNGTILALERGAVGGIYNIGGGRTISLNDAIGLIAGHVGVEPIVHREPARPGDQRHTSADVSRARATRLRTAGGAVGWPGAPGRVASRPARGGRADRTVLDARPLEDRHGGLGHQLQVVAVERLSMYSISSRSRSSKVIVPRPLTCHRPVMPGTTSSRSECHKS